MWHRFLSQCNHHRPSYGNTITRDMHNGIKWGSIQYMFSKNITNSEHVHLFNISYIKGVILYIFSAVILALESYSTVHMCNYYVLLCVIVGRGLSWSVIAQTSLHVYVLTFNAFTCTNTYNCKYIQYSTCSWPLTCDNAATT